MPAILPQGVAGCVLTVAPDVLDLRLPVAGTVELSVPIHTSINFIGYTFHQQVLALEFSALGHITALTGTNSLQLVKGLF